MHGFGTSSPERHLDVPAITFRETVEQMARLYESGLSLARVGHEVDADAATVRRQLLARGVSMRDTHDQERLRPPRGTE